MSSVSIFVTEISKGILSLGVNGPYILNNHEWTAFQAVMANI